MYSSISKLNKGEGGAVIKLRDLFFGSNNVMDPICDAQFSKRLGRGNVCNIESWGASWTVEKAATYWVIGRVVVAAAAFLSPLTSCLIGTWEG
ncbi:hypothetical protein VNO77_34838 [Canavalia gladiata]|uniref:Uncharacterized protein n=1 Tax=Canavalia gladiata TaxID=3824 RepID=A0AAN9PZF6_CANGL